MCTRETASSLARPGAKDRGAAAPVGEAAMLDWNVVATVRDGRYRDGMRLLQRFGHVERTDYFNLVLLQAEDGRQLLDDLLDEGGRDPDSLKALASVVPVFRRFTFQSAEEFEEKARRAVSEWLPQLWGKPFHLRMRRRGFKGKLSSLAEEQFLDRYLLQALEAGGEPGRIAFDDPDVIIALETVGSRAGLSLWKGEELRRYPLLHLD
jgi:hypothetical protein